MEFIKKYVGICLLLMIAVMLIFTRLGDASLWYDEQQTAVLSVNTLEYGYPTVWDGENLTSHSEGDFNSRLIHTSIPWGQFYICAASIKLFGKTNFAVRFPFALLGVITILILWKLSLLVFRKIQSANLSALIATLFVPYLLYTRQCRYYSLVFFFTVLSTYFYIRLLRTSIMTKTKLSKVGITLSVAGLMLSNHLACLVFCGAIIVHIFLIRVKKRKIFRIAIPVSIGIFASSPMIIYMFLGTNSGGGGILSIGRNVALRLLTSIWKVQVFFIPFIIFGIIVISLRLISNKKRGNKQIRLFTRYSYFFPILVIVNILAVSLPDFYIMSHYFLSVVVVAPIIICAVVIFISRFSKPIALVVLIICLSSNLFNIMPYFLIDKNKINNEPVKITQESKKTIFSSSNGSKTHKGLFSSPNTLADGCLIQPLDEYIKQMSIKSYLSLYMQEITHHYKSPIEEVLKILNEHRCKNENILVCAVEYEYIFFYTDNRVVNLKLESSESDLNLYPKTNKIDYKTLINVPSNEINVVILSRNGPVPAIEDSKYLSTHLSEFNEIEVNAPDLGISNCADLENHNFVTNKTKSSFIILMRKK